MLFDRQHRPSRTVVKLEHVKRRGESRKKSNLTSPSSAVHDLELAVAVEGRNVSLRDRHCGWCLGQILHSLAVDTGYLGAFVKPVQENKTQEMQKDLPESSEGRPVDTVRPNVLHLLPLLRLGLLLGDPLLLEEDVAGVEHLAISALIGTRAAAEAL
jgi:hypothetical protein